VQISGVACVHKNLADPALVQGPAEDEGGRGGGKGGQLLTWI